VIVFDEKKKCEETSLIERSSKRGKKREERLRANVSLPFPKEPLRLKRSQKSENDEGGVGQRSFDLSASSLKRDMDARLDREKTRSRVSRMKTAEKEKKRGEKDMTQTSAAGKMSALMFPRERKG